MYSTDDFYATIKSFSNFSDFTRLETYSNLPLDWFVVVADIKNSTDAINKGLYKEVNSISTATVAVVLNAIVPLKIPYVFGGDGATFCIPPSKKESIQSALVAVKKLARESFNLQLRVGIVPMSLIKEHGYDIFIGKYQPLAHFQQAMFQGNGLDYAESLIKNSNFTHRYHLDEEKIESNANFEGFECRWDEIPSSHEETVAIIVRVIDTEIEHKKQSYDEIFQKILSIYGDEKQHHPLRAENLSLTLSLAKLSSETRIRTAFQGTYSKVKYLFRLLLLSLAGKYLMARNIKSESVDWGQYKQRLITNTDYRKFDEVLRMVISGTKLQREELTAFLTKLHDEKKIVFGMHPSPSAIVTCMIFNYDTEHIHFLDGSNGGYAMAAKYMKEQLKSMKS
ncbi:MAG TPA: DUF3095 domain-containing protein [Sulfurovum sp.]|nr:MAG: hypothetical protein B7Y23_07905 [Sulfurovum sp. 16-42-52]OYZ50383.1 MAG: hypothetical protein B7Y13_01430 [Sulfurovum sp. 24-42-9]OZA44746.1 MAG: hypothetical protein B7X80_06970 [Sulfurovum sp. 17-42-90]OZA59532.1 MAG: hypothetical protein B7X69_07615 [Sulfurovum sp. 39-42-12]HQR74013.1 DUF3095 domain-containing protein [Sulfurovum sp.]